MAYGLLSSNVTNGFRLISPPFVLPDIAMGRFSVVISLYLRYGEGL